ncbi:MAG TPA: hypothetical protein VE242_07015, partial [Chthoniobacterales bacterium]|nr:hypothetical protein [Chthoniobacterales bacterium]
FVVLSLTFRKDLDMKSRWLISVFAAIAFLSMLPGAANAGSGEIVYRSYSHPCCGDPCSFWTRVRQAFDVGYPYDYCYDYDIPRPCPAGEWKP